MWKDEEWKVLSYAIIVVGVVVVAAIVSTTIGGYNKVERCRTVAAIQDVNPLVLSRICGYKNN